MAAPTESNPFVFSRPLGPGESIGRQQEVAELLSNAEGGHHTVLSAPRRYGKTTLLKQLQAESEALGMAAIYVDFYGVLSVEHVTARLENAYETSLHGAIRQVWGKLMRGLHPRAAAGVPGVASVEVGTRTEGDHEKTLGEILDLPLATFQRTGTRTLIIFDEFQDVLRAREAVDAVIRSRIQHHGAAATYVFAGSHRGLIAELFGSSARPLYGMADIKTLNPLDRREIELHVRAAFEATSRAAGTGLAELLEAVRGHPQRAMLAAHHLWRVTPRGAIADKQEWRTARRAALAAIDHECTSQWTECDREEQTVLREIATGKARYSLGPLALAAGRLEAAAWRLRDLGILVEGPWGGEFVDPLFQQWVYDVLRQRPTVRLEAPAVTTPQVATPAAELEEHQAVDTNVDRWTDPLPEPDTVISEAQDFDVGDVVVYPHHGAGRIVKREFKDVLGEKREYLTIKITHNDMTVMVPAENASKAGLRHTIDHDGVERVIAILSADPTAMPKNWNTRFKHNRDKIKTGDIYELAEVVRNLGLRDGDRGLSTGENQMYTRAKKILAAELSYPLEMYEDEAEQYVDDVISNRLPGNPP